MIPPIPIITIAISWMAAATSMCPRTLPSDADALAKLLSNVESSRSVFEFKFEVATVLVVIGVVCEVLIVLLEFRKDLREFWDDLALWKEGKSGAPHKPVLWHVLTALLAAVFVACGVAGEFWYELKVGVADSCIEQADNARATILQKEAGTAASNAKGAAGAAASAIGESAVAVTLGQQAGENAKEVSRSAAELAIQLAAAKEEVSELQKSEWIRSFDQVDSAKALAPFAGPQVFIEVVPEFEAIHTASLIEATLAPPLSRWNVHPVRVRYDDKLLEDFPYPGVSIDENCSSELDKDFPTEVKCFAAWKAMAKVLSDNGLRDIHISSPTPELPFNSLLIRVGLRAIAGDPYRLPPEVGPYPTLNPSKNPN